MICSKRFVIIPIALGIWTVWLIVLGSDYAFSNLINNWQISVTMLFGSVIAGATSIGGGAVAFPVFTKLLQIPPHDAKVFSLAIQSVGMGAATLSIILTGIKVDWFVIVWASLGGVIGIFLGAGFIAQLLIPPIIKLSFTMMLTSFAITLFVLNQNERLCQEKIPVWTSQEIFILVAAGVLGGIMSGLVGNGVDIIVFSVIVLLFRMNEKVATPTSVVLMAFNAIAGFIFSLFVFNDFTIQAQSYWLAAIPVVVVGAPLGTILCSLMNRKTIANILIGLILVELMTSLLLIPLQPDIIYPSLIILAIFSGLYYWMYSVQFYEPPIKQALLLEKKSNA